MSEAFLMGGGQVHRLVGERGETPPCPGAKFKRGDLVRPRRRKAVAHFPAELVVLVAIPPGFSPSDALADLLGERRPLMKQVGKRAITYILAEVGNPDPYLCAERYLLSTGQEPVEVAVSRKAPEKADE